MLDFTIGKRLQVRVMPSAVALWLCFFAFVPPLQAVVLAVAMLLHECGHLCMLFGLGKGRVRLRLSCFGAQLLANGQIVPYSAQIRISLGGVLFNLLSALLVGLFFRFFAWSLLFVVSSLVIAVLNLIPVRALDGGRALEAMLLCRMEPEQVDGILCRVNVVCLLGLFALSFYVLWASGFNFSLLLFTLYLSLCSFW